MYDPDISDNYYEWVELYNPTNKSINVSEWTITDNKAKDTIEGDFDHGNGTTVIPPFEYALIADHGTKIYDNFTIPNNTIRLYVDDKSIGNGLGNSGDKLILKNNLNETIDSIEWIINYTDIPGDPIGPIQGNYTISRYDNTNDSSKDFYEGIPTPGEKNKLLLKGKTDISVEKTSFLIRRNETMNIIINVRNLGDFFDNITIRILNVTDNWRADIENNKMLLYPNETKNITLQVYPCQLYGCNFGNLTILAETEKDVAESDSITLFFEILAPDLWIKKIKVYGENKEESNVFKQGEIIRIKSFLKNLGDENASNVGVVFYYDEVGMDYFIGSKNYDSVGKYQKYPSVLWDTVNVEPGLHTIIVVADKKDLISELNEQNNRLTFRVDIFNTSPSFSEKQLLITELYYHTHPNLNNEFIKIYNPTDEKLNISGWYLTNNPLKVKLDQRKMIFPNNTCIPPKSFLCIAQKADDYKWETGVNPDFEFYENTDDNVADMIVTGNVVFSNKGGIICLKNPFNHTVDVVIYGETNYNLTGWNSTPIEDSGKGFVLKRSFDNNYFVDTDSKIDWDSSQKIGQSCFPYTRINFSGEIITFTSPDNSYNVIVDEIRRANNSIYLNIYEFTHPLLCDELIFALLRNVSVNIFLEGAPVGGIGFEEKYVLNRVANYGGKIRFIVSQPENKIYNRYNYNHGKYLVIDNETIIVESCNWVTTGIPVNPSFGNREWGIVVRNKTVAKYFLQVFLDDFNIGRCDSISINNMNMSVPSGFYMFEKFPRGWHIPCFESMVFKGNFTAIPVFSPDTSVKAVYGMLDKAMESIYIEQLYIYKDWELGVNPLVIKLVEKAEQGVDVRIILNYNPFYDSTNIKCNQTKQYLEQHGILVKYVYTNWSYFTNVHNKGVIVDNESVLISSINWNENSFTRNREAGIIIENETIAEYYADVFFYDWNLTQFQKDNSSIEEIIQSDQEHTIYIISIFTLTFALIARDWRKRKWT